MTTTWFVGPRIAVVACALSLWASTPVLAQRADRAIISGVVTDAQGAAVPGATVTIRNEATGVNTVQVTNAAGAYTSPPLVLGRYSVTVDLTGFKKAVSSSILLEGGDQLRQDMILQVGGLNETVEVKSDAGLSETQPDVSHTVNEKYYRDLPIITAGDVRLAESVLQMQPGYLPMKPNGDPMFRGSQFQSRINGGQRSATENFFDGAAFGYASAHQQSQESTPPVESVQEVKVTTTSYSAQYGHTSGGFIEYTAKTGTNAFHGSGYGYFADDTFNKKGFFAVAKTPLSNNNYGATLGGPVIRNKTFFFGNFDYTRLRSGVLPGFGNTTPTDAFKAGDFGALLTGNQIGTDALGRPIFGGQIFNPATTRMENGVLVRDPYPGNRIPAGDPLRSQVAAKIAALMVHPDRAGTANNVAGNPAGDQTWVLNARNMLGRLDHSFTPNFKVSASFYWNRRPSIRNCGETGGCTTEFDGETEPEKNNTYYGQGFYQRISTHHAHQQFDWVIRNNLLNHSTVAWDRWFMGGNSLSAGVGWPQLLWGANQGGLIDNTAGPPMMNFTGNTPYTNIGQQWQRFGYEKNDRWQFSNDLTWVKGRHTAKVGVEYRHHTFPSRGWATNTGGAFNFDRLGTGGYDSSGNNLSQTGDPFASFLLGQVQQSSQTIPVYPTFNEGYTAAWINDEFKVSDKLTVTLGLRFDYQFARSERDDQVLDLRSEHAQPGGREYSRRVDFRGKRPGPHREPEVPRVTGQGRLGPAGRFCVPTGRQERHPRRLRSVLLGSRFRPRRSSDGRLPGQSAGPEPVQRRLSRVLSRQRLPARPRDVPAVHQPGLCQRHRTARGDAERIDLAAVPELVRDLPAPAHRQHDAGRVVHREPRQPPVPQCLDAGRGRQHERPERAGARCHRAAVEYQLGDGPGCRNQVPISRFHRECGAGAAKISAVPEHPVARRADGRESVPCRRNCARAAIFPGPPGQGGIHILQTA